MSGSGRAQPGGLRVILADRSVVTVVALAFVVMLGTGLVLPILPLYVRSFGVGYDKVGLLVAAYAVTRLGADLVSGFVVDRFGERRTAAGGLALVSASALATGLAPSYAAAVGFWAGAGLGSALVMTSMFSYLLKVVPAERMARTMSVFYGSFNVGVVAGGFAAGVIAHQPRARKPPLLPDRHVARRRSALPPPASASGPGRAAGDRAAAADDRGGDSRARCSGATSWALRAGRDAADARLSDGDRGVVRLHLDRHRRLRHARTAVRD